jgi:hypothetical protein
VNSPDVPITGSQLYMPKEGDIVVIDRSSSSKHGHIAEYDGQQWVSDFFQRNASPYKNKDIHMTFFRYPKKGEDCDCK